MHETVKLHMKSGLSEKAWEEKAHAWLYRGQILALWPERGVLSFEDSSRGHPESHHASDNVISKNPEIDS